MISLIAAVADNSVIGHDNSLPWKLKRDLQRFKEITEGHPIIMGRKTYESIGRPLPNRANIILTRDESYSADGCTVVHSKEAALNEAQDKEVFVIGGEMIYRLFMDTADKLYITHVHADIEGDTHFPEIDDTVWKSTEQHKYQKDEENDYNTTFCIYERKE